MKLQIIALGELPSPWIVDDDSCAKLRGLHHRFNFSAILRSESCSFSQQDIDGTLFVPVATLEEGVSLKEGLQAIFCQSTFEEIFSDSFWHQHN